MSRLPSTSASRYAASSAGIAVARAVVSPRTSRAASSGSSTRRLSRYTGSTSGCWSRSATSFPRQPAHGAAQERRQHVVGLQAAQGLRHALEAIVPAEEFVAADAGEAHLEAGGLALARDVVAVDRVGRRLVERLQRV